MRALLKRLEPPLDQLEGQYRENYLHADIIQGLLFALIVTMANLVFVPIDLTVLRERPDMLLLTLTLRVTMVLGSICFGVLLRRMQVPARYDRLVFGYTIVISIAQCLSTMTRVPSFYGNSTFDIILILCFYLVVPNSLPYRIASAAFASSASLTMLFLTREPSLLYWTSIPIAMLGVNLIGLMSSTLIYNYRRNAYQAICEAQLLNQRLTVLAEIDSLTGAFNRRKFLELGADEFSRYQRYKQSVSLMVADVDFFKRINDQHGHPTGDAVLLAVAKVMLESKRIPDSLGRLGGEEFALLLPETALAAALAVAERVRQQVQAAAIATEHAVLTVTFSAGVVEIGPDDASFDDALRRADQLLYRAKERGRNRIES